METPEFRLAHHQPGVYPAESLAVPLHVLAKCRGRYPAPVTFTTEADHAICVAWLNEQVPQRIVVEGATQSTETTASAVSTDFAINSLRLWQALSDAAATADNQSRRYALGCIQLRGAQGAIVATDGRCQSLEMRLSLRPIPDKSNRSRRRISPDVQHMLCDAALADGSERFLDIHTRFASFASAWYPKTISRGCQL